MKKVINWLKREVFTPVNSEGDNLLVTCCVFLLVAWLLSIMWSLFHIGELLK